MHRKTIGHISAIFPGNPLCALCNSLDQTSKVTKATPLVCLKAVLKRSFFLLVSSLPICCNNISSNTLTQCVQHEGTNNPHQQASQHTHKGRTGLGYSKDECAFQLLGTQHKTSEREHRHHLMRHSKCLRGTELPRAK